MYRTNIQRIMESAAHVAHALYSNEINYAEIITAYHHLANTLECTGRKDEAAIVDQIITGYQRLQQNHETQPHYVGSTLRRH
jgi:hypothetical protein